MEQINNKYQTVSVLEIDSISKTYVVNNLIDNRNEVLRIFNRGAFDESSEDLFSEIYSFNKIKHPNLLAFYDFDIVDGMSVYKNDMQYFYTREYIETDSFVDYVDLNYEDRILVLNKLFYAVSLLHFRGVVYSLLSFNNIFIFRENGELLIKLNDLASVSLFNNDKFTDPKDSVFYVSGRETDQISVKADIYSLGVLAYFLVSGKDYRKESINYSGLDKLPDGISESIKSAIHIDASRRPSSVLELWTNLQMFLPLSYTFEDKLYYETMNFESIFVAHQTKRGQLLSLFRDYFNNKFDKNTVLIRSKRGMGKSRFLNELNYHCRLRGYNPILINAENPKKDEFFNFKKAVNHIFSVYTPSAAVVEKYGPDLLNIVPEFSNIWNCEKADISDNKVFLNRIISRFLGLLKKAAVEFPFVFIIDNIDKLNAAELKILYSLIKSGIKPGPFLILSASDMPAEFQEWGIGDETFTMEIGPFNYQDTVYYLKNALNIDDEAKNIAKNISGICHGNPRKIENVICFMKKMKNIEMGIDRKWKINSLDFTVSVEELNNLGYKDFDSVLESFSKDAVTIIHQFAVFSQQVDVFFAIEFSNLGGKKFLFAIKELLDSGIIIKSTSDWGNYYEFSDFRLSSAVYQTIEKDERNKIHLKIATYYEKKLHLDAQAEHNSFVYHLIKSEQNEKAIESLKDMAEHLQKYKMLNEPNEYYEYALSISDFNQFPEKFILISETIADIYYQLGDVKTAEFYCRNLIKITKENGFTYEYCLALSKIISLYLYQNQLEKASDIYRILENNLKNFNFTNLNAKLKYLKIALKIKLQNFDEAFVEFSGISNMPVDASSIVYIGRIKLEEAKYYIQKSDYKKARECVYSGIELFESYSNKVELVLAYHLLGIIDFKCNKPVYEYEVYFNKAFGIADSGDFLWEHSFLILDMGYARLMQDDFDLAKKYFLLGEKYASQTHQYDALMLSSIRMTELSLILEDYSMCKLYIEKYRDFFEIYKNRKLELYYYNQMLIAAEMYIELKSFEKAGELMTTLEAEGMEYLNSKSRLKFRAIKLKSQFFISDLKGEEFESSEFEKLFEDISSFDESDMLKKYALDMIIDSYLNEDMMLFNSLLSSIQNIIGENEKTSIAFKYELCIAISTESEEILSPYVEHITYNAFTYSWKIYCVLADLQFKQEKYVKSLANYIEARGQFIDRLNNTPLNHRAERIEMDTVLSRIGNRIIDLQDKIFGLNFLNMKNSNYIFDNLLPKIVSNKEYKKYIREVYGKIFSISISTWEEYIFTLDEDHYTNIECLIKFLTQYSIAQFGSLILLDDNGDIAEIFSTNKYYKAPILDYISKTKKEGDYFIEQKSWEFSMDVSNVNEISKLFFPIYLNDAPNLFYRRKGDSSEKLDTLLGYVYLESNRVINNINPKLYRKIIKYEALMALVINSYNINKKSTIDKLTGVYIRSYVQKSVKKLLERSSNQSLAFSVLMIDIDHFKDVNDTYGHTKGDEVLRNLGKILKKTLRKTDIIGRYGGEEFIIVLENAGEDKVFAVADNLRLNIANAKLMGDERALTVSIGAASYPMHGKKLSTLIEKADKALYISKNNGRNRVSIFDPSYQNEDIQYDKLQGILGISASEDSRRSNAMVEMIRIMSNSVDLKSSLGEFLGRILDIVEAREVCVLLNDGSLFSRRRDNFEIFEDSILEEKHIKMIKSSDDGYYVDWKSKYIELGKSSKPNWLTYLVSSLFFQGRNIGKIFLWSTLKEHEFEDKHYKFVSAVSPMLAAVLDVDEKNGNKIDKK